MTCTCPSTQLEAYARWHDLSSSEQWRRYHLTGEARTTPSLIHHPGCPFKRTPEQLYEQVVRDFNEAIRPPWRTLADDLPGSY